MAHPSPLLSLHEQGEALFADYGPPGAAIPIVQAFDPVEVEYAAVRRHTAIIDAPARATLLVSGPDRVEFLNRMLTQELKGLAPFTARRAFWLSRKGRIDADLRVIAVPEGIILDVDAHAAARTVQTLGSYIVMEDCRIQDRTALHHRLSLHGPAAAALLARHSEPAAGAAVADIRPGEVSVVRVGGASVTVDRWDSTGEIGLELLMSATDARAVYETLSTPWTARAAGVAAAPGTDLARRIGWHAYNLARVEAGTPLYLLDFGPDSLPHETGAETLRDRVSFTKGCYLGQEIVARMQSLGKPKQRLVGLRVGAGTDAQAVTGTPVLASDLPDAAAVGAVTSSIFSPMNGGAAVCFAMVKTAHAAEGAQVFLDLGSARTPATVRESLSFLAPGAAG